MAAPFDLNDDSVVVIIGTGAAAAHWPTNWPRRASASSRWKRAGGYLPEDYVNDEWDSFGQLAWTDPRTTSGDWRVAKDFSGLPAWIVKAVGGTTTHWAGASLRFQEHEWKAATTYGPVQGANLLDWPIDAAEMAPWYDQGREQAGRDPHRRPSRPARQQQLPGVREGRQGARLRGGSYRPHGDPDPRGRRPDPLPADRLLLPGLQMGRQMVHRLYRNPRRRGHRQP